MDALEIEGDKHNVVYISGGQGRGVKAWSYTRRAIHGSGWSGFFCVARVSGGVIERCEGERASRVVSPGHANV